MYEYLFASLAEADSERTDARPAPAPGKVTRTAAIQRRALGTRSPPIQRAADLTDAPAPVTAPPGDDPFALHLIDRIAVGGVAGGGGALPFADTIQRAFGRHDVGHVTAHVGGAATEAAGALGARAYAMGDRVAFAGAPDLHTAAHEAAHVVQQRAGVHLKDGLDEGDGDPYERHADAVADAVVAGRSAEALLDGAPAGGGATAAVQRIKLLPGEGVKKLRRIKQGEKGTVDTELLGADALKVLLAEMEGYDKPLALEIRREREQRSPVAKLELDDIAEVFGLEAELAALELVKQTQGADKVDNGRAKALAAKLSAAHVLLQSVVVPSEASIYRDTITAYTGRLLALDRKLKLKHDGDEALDVNIAIDGAARTGYRNDILQNAVWGGLAEAEVIAQGIHKTIHIFRLDGTDHYRRVTTIGSGVASTHHLLHLGNHYVAIANTVADGDAAGAGDGRVETVPDGNCMYEALYICTTGRAPTAHQRQLFITQKRAYASAHITDDAIDTSIVGMLAHGDRAGLGPNMKGLVKGKQDDARISELDPKQVAARIERFAAIKDKTGLDYQARAETYLAARKVSIDSDKTKAALGELEQAFSAAEVALTQQTNQIDPSQIELPMTWFDTVKTAHGDKLVGADDPFAVLAVRVGKFNDASRAGKATIGERLAELAAIDDAFSGAEIPDGVAYEPVRIAIYRFQTIELRRVRANLVGLYQLTEGSQFRSGGPGNRPEMHYDVYADGEDVGLGQRVTPKPAAQSKAGAKTVKEFKPVGEKGVQEALSAAALQAKYPSKFGNITKARTFSDIVVNVEYWDNDGLPWDQVAGHSHVRGGADVGPLIAKAVKDHLDNKDFPARSCATKEAGSAKRHPCGAILDCTYLDHNDYVRMWDYMIQHIDAKALRDRVVEINVPFAKEDAKGAHSKGKAAVSNTTNLDSCRVGDGGDEPGRIYPIAVASVAKFIPDLATELAEIRAGRGRPGDTPQFRNHGGALPNTGSYFLEYYCSAGSMPSGAELRLVYDKPSDLFYLTGTHYRAFMSPYSSAMRNPFFRLT